MDYLKAPADNLYKFLAIGGIVALIATAIVGAPQYRHLEEISRQYEREISDGINEYHSLFPSRPNFNEIDVDGFNDILQFQIRNLITPEEQLGAIDHLGYHDRVLSLLSAKPQKGDQKAKEFWMEKFSLTDAEFDSALASTDPNNIIARTVQRARELRPKQQKLVYTLYDVFDVQLLVTLLDWGIAIALIVCLTATITGFVLWYSRVQKFNDRILVHQLNELELKTRAGTTRPDLIDAQVFPLPVLTPSNIAPSVADRGAPLTLHEARFSDDENKGQPALTSQNVDAAADQTDSAARAQNDAASRELRSVAR